MPRIGYRPMDLRVAIDCHINHNNSRQTPWQVMLKTRESRAKCHAKSPHTERCACSHRTKRACASNETSTRTVRCEVTLHGIWHDFPPYPTRLTSVVTAALRVALHRKYSTHIFSGKAKKCLTLQCEATMRKKDKPSQTHINRKTSLFKHTLIIYIHTWEERQP